MNYLFLDFDGIIGNFDKYLYQVSRAKHPALANIPDTYMPKKMDFRCIEGFDFFKALAELPATWPGELPIIEGARRFIEDAAGTGAKVILLTSVPEKAGIYRLNQMVQHGMHFDEAYFTMGQKKSDFINTVLAREERRYGSFRAFQKFVFVDDMAKNALDVVQNCPDIVKVVTCDIPYNNEILAKAAPEHVSRLNLVPHVPEDMEETARAMYEVVVNILR